MTMWWCNPHYNVYMIPPPQVIPNNIKPIKDSNIKPKTFSTIGIGGEFDVKKTPLSPPGTKVVITQVTTDLESEERRVVHK